MFCSVNRCPLFCHANFSSLTIGFAVVFLLLFLLIFKNKNHLLCILCIEFNSHILVGSLYVSPFIIIELIWMEKVLQISDGEKRQKYRNEMQLNKGQVVIWFRQKNTWVHQEYGLYSTDWIPSINDSVYSDLWLVWRQSSWGFREDALVYIMDY